MIDHGFQRACGAMRDQIEALLRGGDAWSEDAKSVMGRMLDWLDAPAVPDGVPELTRDLNTWRARAVALAKHVEREFGPVVLELEHEDGTGWIAEALDADQGDQ